MSSRRRLNQVLEYNEKYVMSLVEFLNNDAILYRSI